MRDFKPALQGTPRLLRLAAGIGVALATLVACDGTLSGDNGGAGAGGPGPLNGAGNGSGGSIAVGPDSVGPRPLSRLSRREYNNTVRDLLGDSTHPADEFPDDHDRSFLFRRAGLVATQDADLLRTTAEALATKAIETPSSVLPCEPSSGEDACAAKFIADFGKRAFRRPLSDAEKMRLTALYQNARTTQQMTFNQAIETLLEAMLQSPAFLYHWESPYEAPKLVGAAVQLGPYAVASRLSYFIWGSMPDQALFDAAAAGKLGSDAEIAAEARRMLADDKAKDAATAFFREWLELEEIGSQPKDGEEYAAYNDELKTVMVDGTEAFVQNVLFESGGKLETLLTANYTFSNQLLGSVYGNGATGATVSKTMLDPSQRLGLLTEPSFLSLTGSPDGSNPVKRGKAVYQKLLCGELPPPPPNVPPAKPATAGGTTRQRFAEHGLNACAAGCHKLMDPIGNAFEHYDGIGRYRTMDNGQPVDSTGVLEIDGAAKPFTNALELTKILATSDSVRNCFAKQWFRFAVGRTETDADAPSLQSVAAAFATNQFDMRDLAPAVAVSRSFRYRSLAMGEVAQ